MIKKNSEFNLGKRENIRNMTVGSLIDILKQAPENAEVRCLCHGKSLWLHVRNDGQYVLFDTDCRNELYFC